MDAGIDIVECGFLIEDVTYEKDVTRFNSLDQISHIIPQDRDGKIFVALMDYGKYNEELLPDYDGTSIDGLRIAFHKNNYIKALDVCKRVKDKGYKVFVQPMVSVSYTDEEFLDLIRRVNNLEPYAFYIVDSFGMMKRKDLTRFFTLLSIISRIRSLSVFILITICNWHIQMLRV